MREEPILSHYLYPLQYRKSIYRFCHLFHAVGSRYGVEVYAGHTVSNELFALGRTPLNAYLAHLVVALAAEHLSSEGLWNINLEGFRDDAELASCLEGLDAGDDGDGDSFGTSALNETEILLIIIEQLGHCILGASLDLLSEPMEVHLHIGRLIVFFGVAGYAIREGLPWLLDGRAIAEEALVEAIDLRLQLYGVAISIRGGGEHTLVLCLVSTKEEQVGDAEELQVEQYVLGLFAGESTTENMGHHGNVVAILDSCRYGYCTGTATQRNLVEYALGRLLINVFAAVRGDVDVAGGKLTQLVNGAEQAVYACALERWQHFERECRACIVCYGVNDAHRS